MKFPEFPSIKRLSREMIVTEKLDGTNASVYIFNREVHEGELPPHFALPDGFGLAVGSRTRWITPQDDNFGFARWVEANLDQLSFLGEGQHFGEWWGAGIQRGYGLKEKRFSLFNTSRWGDEATRPACCGVVPVLYAGLFDTYKVDTVLDMLASGGSQAAPGFDKPEGVVVYHVASRSLFKKTLDKNDGHKGGL